MSLVACVLEGLEEQAKAKVEVMGMGGILLQGNGCAMPIVVGARVVPAAGGCTVKVRC